MRFPLDNPIFQFFYWLVNTPGLGGLFVGLIVVFWVIAAGSAVRWIARGALADEPETYAYPTPALHEHTS
jgi:hypothetical protein